MPAKILMLRNQLAAAETALNALLQTRSTLQTRDADLEARLTAAEAEDPELQREIEENDAATTANEEAITEANANVENLRAQISEMEARAARAIGAPAVVRSHSDAMTRAAQFQRTGRQTIGDLPSFIRADPLLVSGGTVATPTGVGGINGPVGPQVGSLIDMIPIIDATGMGSWREAYEKPVVATTATAEEVASPEMDLSDSFGYVDFMPTEYPVTAYIGRQVLKQSPLAYEQAVRAKVRTAMRKALSAAATSAIVSSNIVAQMEVAASGIDQNFLSNLILSYGGDEGVDGTAVLNLTKADLKAIASVRGKNEYLPVYTIIPDTFNPNIGVIKDNHGLSCRYALNSACASLTGSSAGDITMFYGNPNCAKMAIWGDVDVRVYEGHKVEKRLLTIAGDLTADVHAVVLDGFVSVKSAG